MHKLLLFASLLLSAGAAAGAQGSPDSFAWATEAVRAPVSTAPRPDAVRAPVLPAPRTEFPADPADSLYRLARAAMTDGDFRKAATLFQQVIDRYPDSEFAPDALYYKAYALYKTGSSSDLKTAILALDRQATRYPKAGTLSDAKQLRASIMSEQAKRGDPKVAYDIARGGRELQSENRCPTDDDEARVLALQGLMQLDPDQVLPVLQKVLERKDECSIRLRARAVNMVAQTKEEERADILLRVASTDPSAEVRREAVQWLSSVNTERAAKALDSILFNAIDADTRERALSALSQHRNPSARVSLRKFAEQSNIPTDQRVHAVYYLAQRRTGEESDFLRGLYNKTASPEIREAIIQAVSSQRTTDRIPWLLGIARDKGQEIELRKKAIYYAGQASAAPGTSSSSGPTYAVDLKDLLPMYDEFNGQQEMQEQMLYVYAQRRETEATDKLLAIAKAEKNPELRKKAISWLTQRKDPRVKQFLLDLLSQ
jgi:HEAT repeat protein